MLRLALAAIGVFAPLLAHAQFSIISGDIPGCDFVTGRLTTACIPSFIAHLIQLVFSLLGLFFLLNVMYAGYEIAIGAATSGSGKEQGMRRLFWAITGLVVSVCAFVILDLVVTVLVG